MPRAERDLEHIFGFIGAFSSDSARRWFNGLVDSIGGLSEDPQRHPVIQEDSRLRHMLYGNKPHIYRIIYSIDIGRERVDIVHVRHRARRSFRASKTMQ